MNPPSLQRRKILSDHFFVFLGLNRCEHDFIFLLEIICWSVLWWLFIWILPQALLKGSIFFWNPRVRETSYDGASLKCKYLKMTANLSRIIGSNKKSNRRCFDQNRRVVTKYTIVMHTTTPRKCISCGQFRERVWVSLFLNTGWEIPITPMKMSRQNISGNMARVYVILIHSLLRETGTRVSYSSFASMDQLLLPSNSQKVRL